MPGFELIGDEEYNEVKEVFEESKILFRRAFDDLRNGIYKVNQFEKEFAEYMNCRECLAVTSGTAALKVALEGLGIGPGDEVITQAFTFVATVEAIIECRAQPVIADINDTLNIDPQSFREQITSKTKAVIVVHMLGIPTQMDEIMNIAKEHNILVIEDTAWGCGGTYNGNYLGTIGDAGTFSFDFAKTMTTGEGGMVICKNPEAMEKAKAYHDHGHENNPNLPRWEDSRSSSGFNFRMMELQGAVGLAQLRKLEKVIQLQNENKQKIKDSINDLNLTFRTVPEGSRETADALVFFVRSNELALKCRDALLEKGVGTKILPEAISWHFAGTWDHMPELLARHNNLGDAFAKSRKLLDRAVSIPISTKMKNEVPQLVREALENIL